MALFSPSESPSIVVKEIDLTGVVPNVQSTTGAIVGNFRWGPVEQATLIDNEASLAATFGTPTDSSAVDFLSAAYFLRYSSSLQTIRMVGSSATNARDTVSGATPLIKNKLSFDDVEDSLDAGGNMFIARYPGTLGNSLKISFCPVSGDSDGAVTADSAYNNWVYKNAFDGAPRSSTWALSQNATNDEVHVVVVDEDGLISGTRGTVLETFGYVSLATNAKSPEGSTNYIKDVINNRSSYIYLAGFGAGFPANAGINLVSGQNMYDASNDAAVIRSFDSGSNGVALTPGNYATGYDLVADKDTVEIDFLIAPAINSQTDNATVVNNLVSIASQTRKDCVVVSSPAREKVIGTSTPNADIADATYDYTSSSYLIKDNNWLKVYDKYNDKFRFIPAASSTAGLMAATDLNAAPWFSPAGARRGAYLGITGLAYNPTKAQRDVLYKTAVNPIANIPGQGVLLFGDKTSLARPSAFDRINVRRLFLVLERAISLAARDVLFEFNDEFTRAEFVNIVEPFLREIQGRRGITDFRVVCDETNNTPAVVDRNEFIASIFIKPARSINYVTLNFVAVRTGVEFEEVVGTV